MTLNRLVLLGLALGGTLLRLQAAGIDLFLEIDGVPGESKDAKHPEAIVVRDFSLGAANSGSGVGGGGAGKVSFQDISFTKPLDKSSPLLYLNCANGKHLKRATLYVRSHGESGSEFYVITLSEVLVTGIRTTGDPNGNLPLETLSLNFAKIEFSYRAQKPDGSLDSPVMSSWDLKRNSP